MKGKGGDWTFEAINAVHPRTRKAYVPGTIMAFAGVAQAGERADILAYLRTPVRQPGAPAGRPVTRAIFILGSRASARLFFCTAIPCARSPGRRNVPVHSRGP